MIQANTVITGESDKNTVTIDTSEGNVDVTFDDLKIDVSRETVSVFCKFSIESTGAPVI